MRNIEIPLNSTIDDVINIVRKKNNIKDKIIINYKFKEIMKPLESTLTINNIQYLIQEEGPNKKIENNMYINIESKETILPKKDEKDEHEESPIKPKIIIIFTNEKFYPMRDYFEPNSTIIDIINYILTKNDIEDKITIKYKSKSDGTLKSIERSQTVNEVIKFIQETGANNKIENIIYVDIESKEKTTNLKKEEEHEKDIKPEYKEFGESHIRPKLSPRKPFLTKDSDTDTSSSEDDYSKKHTPIRKGKDWSPKTKQEREDFERNPIQKYTTSLYKENPEKKPSALEGILSEKDGGGQIQKNAPKRDRVQFLETNSNLK